MSNTQRLIEHLVESLTNLPPDSTYELTPTLVVRKDASECYTVRDFDGNNGKVTYKGTSAADAVAAMKWQ